MSRTPRTPNRVPGSGTAPAAAPIDKAKAKRDATWGDDEEDEGTPGPTMRKVAQPRRPKGVPPPPKLHRGPDARTPAAVQAPTPIPSFLGDVWLPPLPTVNDDPDAHPYFHSTAHRPRDGGLGPEPELGFKSDFRKDKPGLHMLYVKTATRHLRLIDEQLTALHHQSNLNLMDVMAAIQHQRMVLVFSNAAYWDAEEILRGLRLCAGSTVIQGD